jgi:hypothetical protein
VEVIMPSNEKAESISGGLAALLFLAVAVAGALTAGYGIYRAASEATEKDHLRVLFTAVVLGFGALAALANALGRHKERQPAQSGLPYLLILGGLASIGFAAWGGYLRGTTSVGRIVLGLICGVAAAAMMAALDAATRGLGHG